MDKSYDRALQELAVTRYGLFTRREAADVGLSEKAIERRLDTVWKVIHPTVYTTRTHPGGWHQDLLAACFWSKDGAASHRAAGALFSLPGCERAPVEITVRRCHLAPRAGIKLHHSNNLPPEHLTRVQRIPTTTIERTLLDLGAVWPRIRVAAALDDALRRGLTSVKAADDCLGRVAKRGRRGCRGLRELLRERWLLKTSPQSPLETRLFELIANSSLSLPDLQYRILDRGRFVARVDFCYPEAMLIIEADSWKHHSGRGDWTRDLDRRNQITDLGWRILHITWSDVTDYPERTLARIHKLLPPPNFL